MALLLSAFGPDTDIDPKMDQYRWHKTYSPYPIKINTISLVNFWRGLTELYDEDAVSRDSQINIEVNFFHMISMGGFRSRLCYLGFTSAKADLADLTVLCGSSKN